MPLDLTNFLQAPMVRGTNESLGDMFSGGVNAYQQGQKHKQMMQEQALKNALLQQYGGSEKEAKIGQMEAQADFYRNPRQLMTPQQKIAMDMAGGDPAKYNAFLEKLSQKNSGVTADQYNRHANAKTASAQRQIINEKYLMPPRYIGAGASQRYAQDLNEYLKTTDPEKKKALGWSLARAANAYKTVPEAAGIQLISQGTPRPTEKLLEHQKKAITQGWPSIGSIASHNLPQELQELSNHIHDKFLTDITNVREQIFGELNQSGRSPNIFGNEVSDSDDDLDYVY